MALSLRHMAGALLLAGLVGACASTPSAPDIETKTEAAPANVEARVTAPEHIFTDLEGGGVKHEWSGAECPAELASFAYTGTTLFAKDGSDVACQYEDSARDRLLTIYFSKYGDRYSAREYASGAAQQIMQRFPGATEDQAKSQACSISIGMANSFGALLENGGKSDGPMIIELGKQPCHVLHIATGPSLVAVDIVGDWHLKVRMTGVTREGEADRMVKLTSEVMSTQRAYISGEPVSDIMKLLREDEDVPVDETI